MGKSAPTTIIYSKIGEHRGSLRIWIEGKRLSRAGVSPGSQFDVQSTEHCIRMSFKDGGTHTVSKRRRGDTELPIIDIRGKHLLDAFAADDRVRIVVKAGEIEVTLHHHSKKAAEREERLVSRVTSGKPLLIGSLAHGGGILDSAIHQGLVDSGINAKLAFANELSPQYLETSLANNPVWSHDSIAVQGPMQEVEWNLLPKVDLLVAGLPCTGASLAGRAKNKNHAAEAHQSAGALFVAFLQAITALNPSVIILENVVAYRATPSMMVIRSVLQTLEYDVQETEIRGREFAALEDRDRMCMVATSRGLPAFDLANLPRIGKPTQKLGDILEPVHEADERWRTHEYLVLKAERDREKGHNFKRQIVTPESTEVGVAGAQYWKHRGTEPQVAHPSGDGRSRLLTPREHARAKTIPEFLVDGACSTTAHEILGQSVIYSAFRALARWIGVWLQPQYALPLAA